MTNSYLRSSQTYQIMKSGGIAKKSITKSFNGDIRNAFKHGIIAPWSNPTEYAVYAEDINVFERELDQHWANKELKYDNFK